MGSVLYDDDREPLAGARTPVQPVTAPIVAAQAENILDQARSRVLNASMTEDVSARNEDAVRTLEAQLEASKAEAARVEAARLETEQRAARADAARAEAIRAEAARREAARAEAARAEAARQEAARQDAERLEAERLEAERQQAQRMEAEKAEAARQAEAHAEAERAQAERAEAERAEAEQREAERIETERAEAERAAAERQEQQRAESERLEAEKAEAARIEAERVAAARAEAMARFEASRRAQAEQRQIPEAYAEHASVQPAQWPAVDEPAPRREEAEDLEEATNKSQERLASDFEKLLEAELEADGVLEGRPAPAVTGERREPGFGTPTVNPVQAQTITGATPGVSIEQDMARRLGEISLNKKTDTV
jgi:hypothetical protein